NIRGRRARLAAALTACQLHCARLGRGGNSRKRDGGHGQQRPRAAGQSADTHDLLLERRTRAPAPRFLAQPPGGSVHAGWSETVIGLELPQDGRNVKSDEAPGKWKRRGIPKETNARANRDTSRKSSPTPKYTVRGSRIRLLLLRFLVNDDV